jgi:hypothetical protein
MGGQLLFQEVSLHFYIYRLSSGRQRRMRFCQERQASGVRRPGGWEAYATVQK